MDPRDLARDTSGTRAYADFLVELAGRVPTQIIPNISVLLCHLNGEVKLVQHVYSLLCPRFKHKYASFKIIKFPRGKYQTDSSDSKILVLIVHL